MALTLMVVGFVTMTVREVRQMLAERMERFGRDSFQEPEERPLAREATDERTLRALVDRYGVIELVQRYLQARTWGERAEVVRNRVSLIPAMESYYKSNLLERTSQPQIQAIVEERPGIPEVLRVGWAGPQGQAGWVYVVQEAGAYQVDWEASVQKEPIPWSLFISQRRPESLVYRVWAKRLAIETTQFPEEEFLCLKFAPSPESEFCFGFLARSSPQMASLREALFLDQEQGDDWEVKDPWVAVTVRLRFPAPDPRDVTTLGETGKRVVVEEVLALSWVLNEEGSGPFLPE
ncbi:MAG: hypothetical protein AAF555_05525 [Verrucomicrobiota bacterium]